VGYRGGVTGSGEVTHKYKPGTCGIDTMLAKHTFKVGGSAKTVAADTRQSFRNTLHHAVPPCNIPHYTAPHCNTLQHTVASYHRARWSMASSGERKCSRTAHCKALFAGLFNASATTYLGRAATLVTRCPRSNLIQSFLRDLRAFFLCMVARVCKSESDVICLCVRVCVCACASFYARMLHALVCVCLYQRVCVCAHVCVFSRHTLLSRQGTTSCSGATLTRARRFAGSSKPKRSLSMKMPLHWCGKTLNLITCRMSSLWPLPNVRPMSLCSEPASTTAHRSGKTLTK